MITLTHLKEKGFTLTKEDATELLPHVSHISKYGESEVLVYESTEPNVINSEIKLEQKAKKKKIKEEVKTDGDRNQ